MAVISNSINNKVGGSNSGATNTLTVDNASNTASSVALVNITVGGGTASDAFTTYTVSGTTNWSKGIDNSVSGDPYVISASSSLGTTNVVSASTAGEINYPLQPAFLAYLNTSVPNATGDGTVYTIIYDTEVFDQNADFNLGTSTFTAPVTGRYYLSTAILNQNASVITSDLLRIVTSNRTYSVSCYYTPGSTVQAYGTLNILADMDAADTVTFTNQVTIVAATKTVEVTGTTSGNLRTYASGILRA